MNKTLMLAILVVTMLFALVGCSSGESVSNSKYNSKGLAETTTASKNNTTATTVSPTVTTTQVSAEEVVEETQTEITTAALIETTAAPIETTVAPTTETEELSDGERMVSINPGGIDISTYPAGTIIVGKEIPERYVDCAIKTIAISSWSGELVTYLDQICILGYDEGYPAVRYATYSPSYEEYSYQVTDELLQDVVVDLSSLNVIYEDADKPITFDISEHDKTYRDKWWPGRERQ